MDFVFFGRIKIWQDRVADRMEAAEAEASAAVALAEAEASAAAGAALAAEEDSTAASTEGRDPRIITIIITAGVGAFTVRTDTIITEAADASEAFLGC